LRALIRRNRSPAGRRGARRQKSRMPQASPPNRKAQQMPSPSQFPQLTGELTSFKQQCQAYTKQHDDCGDPRPQNLAIAARHEHTDKPADGHHNRGEKPHQQFRGQGNSFPDLVDSRHAATLPVSPPALG